MPIEIYLKERILYAILLKELLLLLLIKYLIFFKITLLLLLLNKICECYELTYKGSFKLSDFFNSWIKHKWRCEFAWVLTHLRSVMYDIYKNGVVHNTTRLNCWIILWKIGVQWKFLENYVIFTVAQLTTKIMWFDTVGLFSLRLREKSGLRTIHNRKDEIICIIVARATVMSKILTKEWTSVELQEVVIWQILSFMFKCHTLYFNYQ